MKKRITIILSSLAFVGMFLYFYKKSGKVRKSICVALVSAFVLTSGPLESKAKETDAFSPKPPQHRSSRRALSSSGTRANNPGKPNNGDSGDDDNGMPQCPKVESVEETENHIENIDEYIQQMRESSDSESEQCPIHQQNKGGIDELPDSSEYIYALETKTAKKALKKVWKNPNAQEEVLESLRKIDQRELLPRNQKDFKGFKSLKELKFSKTRMLVQPGKDEEPDKIVVICMRRDLEDLVPKLRNKYE